jgi:hypothetical protein
LATRAGFVHLIPWCFGNVSLLEVGFKGKFQHPSPSKLFIRRAPLSGDINSPCDVLRGSGNGDAQRALPSNRDGGALP